MPETLKSLGQTDLTTTSLTTVYAPSTSLSAAISTVAVCNRHTSLSCTYTLAHRPGGASIANAHYLVYQSSLAANESAFLTIGMTMAGGDVLSAQAGTANQLTVQAWGVEKT